VKQRQFCGVPISPLGLGCMRLPRDANGPDQAQVNEMVKVAIDGGVNYFDTAFGYMDGKSEPTMGIALAPYREDVLLATKMPRWNVKTEGDFDRIFAEQLERLRTDYVDFYLMHALDGPDWDRLRGLGAIAWMDAHKASGQVRRQGFSYHGTIEDFPKVLDSYDWDFCQLQYNYMDLDTLACVEYATNKGVPIIIMEPLYGGKLAVTPPEVEAVFAAHNPAVGPIDWAFAWLLDHPGVGWILSGMSNMEQLQQNIATFDKLEDYTMTDADRDMMLRARAAYESRWGVPCTRCEYCLPCPAGVKIPRCFEIYNEFQRFGTMGGNRWEYNELMSTGGPDRCTACGRCEGLCPQNIPIIETLAKISPAIEGK